MKCKDIRLWLMDGKGESETLPVQIRNHLRSCSSCARFWEDLSLVQDRIGLLPAVTPPLRLQEETRRLCLEALEAQETEAPAAGLRRAPLPKIIWAALFLLLGLTAGIVTSLFTDLDLSRGLELKSAIILTIMIQNGVMLFFAPLLLNKLRFSRPETL
jgi:hypothetical protein